MKKEDLISNKLHPKININVSFDSLIIVVGV